MNDGIQGKVVLITGGDTGLGAETARLLASRGALVAVAGRRRAKLDEVVAQITAARGLARGYPALVWSLTAICVAADIGLLLHARGLATTDAFVSWPRSTAIGDAPLSLIAVCWQGLPVLIG